MAASGNRNAARSIDDAYGEDGQPRDRTQGIRKRVGRLVVASDPRDRARHLAPAAESAAGEGREAEILSRLLAPFAGQQANRMAQQLLARFGGLGGLFHAEADAIESLIGRRPDIALQLTLLGDLVRETLRGRAQGMTLFPTPEAVLDFVRFDMLGRRRETLRVLYLDGANQLLSDDIVAEGSVSSLTFHPREVLRRALEVNASAMILVHNHPSSPPHPSLEDIAATRCTARLAADLGIMLHDHLIIARGGWCSLRAEGHV